MDTRQRELLRGGENVWLGEARRGAGRGGDGWALLPREEVRESDHVRLFFAVLLYYSNPSIVETCHEFGHVVIMHRPVAKFVKLGHACEIQTARV